MSPIGVPDHPCPSFSHGWQVNPGCIVRKLCSTTTQSALQPFIPALHTSRKRTAAPHTGTTHFKKAHCSLSYRHYTRQESALQPLIPALHTSRKRTAASHTGTTHVKKAHCSLSYRHYTRQESALQPFIPALHTSRKRTAASHTGTTHCQAVLCGQPVKFVPFRSFPIRPPNQRTRHRALFVLVSLSFGLVVSGTNKQNGQRKGCPSAGNRTLVSRANTGYATSTLPGGT